MLVSLVLLLVSGFQTGNQPQPQAESPNEYIILQALIRNIEAEVDKSANYSCVQMIVRDYYNQQHACAANLPEGKRTKVMRDRLRLDIAVSEGNEIYSWHGENHFTSSHISEVIHNGPRSSGQFVGFLRNIFLTPGVGFKFKGNSQVKGRAVATFDYTVPLRATNWFLQGRGPGSNIPYHGSFLVDTGTMELVQLSMVADDIPAASGICYAESDVEYQMVNIGGHESLLPSSFDVKMRTDTDLYTVNHNEYTQCREFRSESTLLFSSTAASPSAATQTVVDEPLPAGLVLKASLQSSIDDKNSYVGDGVTATLAEPVTVPGKNKVIPAGATLHGVISEMEEHTEGLEYWLFAITFDRLTSGADSYVMNARQLAQNYNHSGSKMSDDQVLTSEAIEAAKHGVWFLDGAHFRFPKKYTRYWETQPVGKKE